MRGAKQIYWKHGFDGKSSSATREIIEELADEACLLPGRFNRCDVPLLFLYRTRHHTRVGSEGQMTLLLLEVFDRGADRHFKR